MKRISAVMFCLLVALASYAQEGGKDTIEGRAGDNSVPAAVPNEPLLFKRVVPIDSAFSPRTPAVPIPTVKPGPALSYKMPVKKLTGENLAPMPGTEPLDLLDKKRITPPDSARSDSLKTLKQLIHPVR